MRCGLLHRWLVWAVTALLYGGAAAFASDAQRPNTAAQPDASVARALEPAVPHIALLLPATSGTLGRAAEAVRLGFMAAAKVEGTKALPVRAYDLAEQPESALLEYRRALANGARVVVGPITREAVTALASSGRVAVPTLALNVPDGEYPLPPQLFVLSLQVEAEAAQVAQLAINEGRRSAVTMVANSPLLQRIQQAFVEAFTRLGGRVVAQYEFSQDPAALGALRKLLRPGMADMAFLALDYAQARLARPYFGALPVYATSQVHPGHLRPLAALDLPAVRFLDMPWLLQPDHPAVMVYPRVEFADAPDLQRLYALGIDAFRLSVALLKGESLAPLDGVTGQLNLGPDRRYARRLTGAQFSDGQLMVFTGRQ